MQREEDNHRSEFTSCNITPEKLQNTPRNDGSGRKDVMLQEVKRKIHYTPHNTPDKYLKTPQSSGSLKKNAISQLECSKRKIQSPQKENLEKIQKTCSSGKFVNTLIAQWSKHVGIQTPLSQTGMVQENLITEEMKRMHVMEERKIQKLQKKLQIAEETISSLSASHEAELRAKEDILQQLNNDWESITKYYYEISESLKGFQQHKDNLSKLYDKIVTVQQSTVKKLQQELTATKLKNDEQKDIISSIENKIVNQEIRIHDMIIAETDLKKQFEDQKNRSIMEKNHLNNVYTEEKLELIKKQENLTSMNQELQVQLQVITEGKQNLTNICTEKTNEIIKLQEQIIAFKNKIEDLLCENTELNAKCEKSIDKEEELSKQLQIKTQEVDRLRENCNERQEIESSLAKDLEVIDNKYKIMQTDFANLKNKLKEAQIHNLNLEKSLQVIKLDNEHIRIELNKKIELLEKEKEQVLSERHSKIQEFENACKSLEKQHNEEVLVLKQEFDVKLAEMEKVIATRNFAFLNLNKTSNKESEENLDRQTNFHDQIHTRTNTNHNKLQEKLEVTVQPILESNLIDVIKRIESQTQMNQIREIKDQQFRDKEYMDKSTIISKYKNEMSNSEQDIYDFRATKLNDELQNILSATKQDKKIRFNLNSPTKVSDYVETQSYLSGNEDMIQSNTQIEKKKKRKNEDKNNLTPKKKIFKTRGTGLRQYGTPRNLQHGTPGKISRK